MNCSRCGKPAAILQRYSGVALCAYHASLDLEAKAKRELRKSGGVPSGARLMVTGSDTAESFAVRSLLSEVFGHRPDISFVCDPKEATAFVTAETLEDCAEAFLRLICRGETAQILSPQQEIILRPLSVIPREEVLLYAQQHGWSGPAVPLASDPFSCDISRFLENFSADHPSAEYALRSVRDQLLELYQERSNHAV